MPKHDEPVKPDELKVHSTPGHIETTGMAYNIGPIVLETVRGKVMTEDAPGYSTLLLDSPIKERRRVAFLSYRPPTYASALPGTGMIVQMTAREAREIAASLLRLADWVENGGMN